MLPHLVPILTGARVFSPERLFAANEPGAWYDPSDLGTLYQDSAGTTPVTAVEQAVGLALDKSRGLVLGPELVVNGGFGSATGWTGAAWSISGGVASATAGTGLLVNTGGPSLTVGKSYLVSFTLGSWSAGTVSYPYDQSGARYVVAPTTPGTYTSVLNVTVGNAISIYADNFTGSIDNISVRELSGTHLIQPGASSRPILRARYNRITRSEEFNHADWQKVGAGTGSAPVVTANDAVAPDGTTTADLIVFDRGAGNAVGDQSYIVQTPTLVSATYTQYVWLKAATAGDVGKQLALRNAGGSGYGVVTLTADWVRYTRTETGSAGNWELNNRGTVTTGNSVSAHVWGADLRSANDTYLPYQRIAAATDYDTVGFPVYLSFDGSDDSMYTGGNLDLSATDKVTLFAGVTKLSDATVGMIAELSAAVTSNNGSFYFAAPGGTGTTSITWVPKGTSTAIAELLTEPSPVTRTVTARSDISADVAILRLDGAQAGASTADQGTGNFGSYPLYVGRRNNTNLPFNGRLYQLIVRGAATSDALVTQAERYVATKQGRTL